MSIASSAKAKAVAGFQCHEKDSGSPEVQISILTTRIASLSVHLKGHAHDHHNRRGLVLMVGKRNRLLKYLARTNRLAYQETIGRLGLRK